MRKNLKSWKNVNESLLILSQLLQKKIFFFSSSFEFSVFTSNYPARTCYQAGNLPIGAAIEIEVIAIVGDVKVEIVNVDPKLWNVSINLQRFSAKQSLAFRDLFRLVFLGFFFVLKVFL